MRGTAPQVRQADAGDPVTTVPEQPVGPDNPTVVEDVVGEGVHDGPRPSMPPRQWVDEPVIVPKGATNYVPDWANMDNWIPVTSPSDDGDGVIGNHGELSPEAPEFRLPQNTEGETAVEQEVLYTLHMQRVTQIVQSPQTYMTTTDNGPADTLLTAMLAHLGRQMASVQKEVSEVRGQCHWLTSQLIPQPYQFVGLVRRVACENNSVYMTDSSGDTSDETERPDFNLGGIRRTTAVCRRPRRSRGCLESADISSVPAKQPIHSAKFQSTVVSPPPDYPAWAPESRTPANTLTSSLTSSDFKPAAVRPGRRRQQSNKDRQTLRSHGSRMEVVDKYSQKVDRSVGLRYNSSVASSPVLFASVKMVRSRARERTASTSKRTSDRHDDSEDDGRKRRPPPRTPSPNDALTFRPHRCRKCKQAGKKNGRRYRSVKGLQEHCNCIVHHTCNYNAAYDRYMLLTADEHRRKLASIRAGSRKSTTSSTYYASPPSRDRTCSVHRVEATAGTPEKGQSTVSASTSSVVCPGATDSRHVVLHPNRLPSVESRLSSDASDSSSDSVNELPSAFAECCGPAVPTSPVRTTTAAPEAASVPPLVEPTVITDPTDHSVVPEVGASSLPNAPPFPGCLPVGLAAVLPLPGTMPPLSSSSGSDTDVSFDNMDVDFGVVDLDIETDGMIINALDRHSDTASPNSPAASAWLQEVVAAVAAESAEADRPPTPAAPAPPTDAAFPSTSDAPAGQHLVEPPATPDPSDPGADEDIPPSGTVARPTTQQTRDAASSASSQPSSIRDATVVAPDTPSANPTQVTMPHAGATADVDTAAAVAPRVVEAITHYDDYDNISEDLGDHVGLPILRLNDMLEAASRIRTSQVGAVARTLARLNYTTHLPEVLADFLMLSVATRLRVFDRLLERLTQYRLTGASANDIVVAIINFLQRVHAEDSRL